MKKSRRIFLIGIKTYLDNTIKMRIRLLFSAKLLLGILFISAFTVLFGEEGKLKASFKLDDGEKITLDSLLSKFDESTF